MSTATIEAQVAELLAMVKRSPVRDGIKELKKVMAPMPSSSSANKPVTHRIVLTNGTGRTERTAEHGELERRPQ